MPECICPSCKAFFSAPSSAFGENYRCASCGAEFKLDVGHLARYKLPSIIRIQLKNTDGTPFTRFAVPVMVEYGYSLPPLLSNRDGQITVTKEMFAKAERDEISTGIMDHKGDYALNRFIHIRVLGKNPSIAAAYVLDEDIVPIEINVDLSKGNDVVNLEMRISTR